MSNKNTILMHPFLLLSIKQANREERHVKWLVESGMGLLVKCPGSDIHTWYLEDCSREINFIQESRNTTYQVAFSPMHN